MEITSWLADSPLFVMESSGRKSSIILRSESVGKSSAAGEHVAGVFSPVVGTTKRHGEKGDEAPNAYGWDRTRQKWKGSTLNEDANEWNKN